MPTYIDGYLLPLPKKNLAAYRKMAAAAAKVWKRHGALRYVESVLDDAGGEFCPSFTKPVKLKSGETLVLAVVTYKSRAHRDRVNKRVMADPELMANCDPKNMPFDPKRMAFSGFSAIVDA
jgi:uncharacterized protein YbaA (DUF1428 family)